MDKGPLHLSAKDLPPGDWRLTVYGSTRITGATTRTGPRQADRRRVTEKQAGRCLYCELPIGIEVWRQRPPHSRLSSGVVLLKPHYDHFVPYSYSLRNAASNWALACHVCNLIKTARMFDTVEQARDVVLPARLSKGYEAPETVLHRLRLKDEGNFEFGVRMPTVLQIAILRELSKGHAPRDIAQQMNMPVAQVRARIRAALRQLRAGSRRAGDQVRVHRSADSRQLTHRPAVAVTAGPTPEGEP